MVVVSSRRFNNISDFVSKKPRAPSLAKLAKQARVIQSRANSFRFALSRHTTASEVTPPRTVVVHCVAGPPNFSPISHARLRRAAFDRTRGQQFHIIHVISMTSAVCSSLHLQRFSTVRRKSAAPKKSVVVRAYNLTSSTVDDDHASRRQVIGTGLAAALAVRICYPNAFQSTTNLYLRRVVPDISQRAMTDEKYFLQIISKPLSFRDSSPSKRELSSPLLRWQRLPRGRTSRTRLISETGSGGYTARQPRRPRTVDTAETRTTSKNLSITMMFPTVGPLIPSTKLRRPRTVPTRVGSTRSCPRKRCTA